MDKLLTFQRYNDPALARAIGDQLAIAGIQSSIIDESPLMDPVLAGGGPSANVHLKLASKDFVRAHAVLEAYYENVVTDVEPDYYLFDFSDEELLEILAKPDEWGYFDYVLARKLLIDRGHPITPEFTEQLKQNRLLELEKYDKPANLALAIPFPYGLAAVSSVMKDHKKVLPDGREIDAFHPKVRRRYRYVFVIVVILLILSFVARFMERHR